MMAERRPGAPLKVAYVQCVCPKHGPTTHLHKDVERDDWCLLETKSPRESDD